MTIFLMVKLQLLKLTKKRQSVKNILEFNNRARSKSKTDKEKTSNTLESINMMIEN